MLAVQLVGTAASGGVSVLGTLMAENVSFNEVSTHMAVRCNIKPHACSTQTETMNLVCASSTHRHRPDQAATKDGRRCMIYGDAWLQCQSSDDGGAILGRPGSIITCS